MWGNLSKTSNGEDPFYSVMKLTGNGMQALREMFPDAKADGRNLVLFSTSGIHGTYNTIEEVEHHLLNPDDEGHAHVTFLVLQPRIVCLRYGECTPENAGDIQFLKDLRASSHKALARIGMRASTPPCKLTLAEHVNGLVESYGGLRAAARALQVDPGYLSRIRSGEKCSPDEAILKKFGLRRVVTFEKLTDSKGGAE